MSTSVVRPVRRARRWTLPLVMVAVAMVSMADSCVDSPTSPREARCDFVNADNRQSCDATAVRNSCRSHSFADLTNVCTGFDCTSCRL